MSKDSTNQENNTVISSKKKKLLWLDSEKRILYSGLKNYGPNNLSKIKMLLPQKSEGAICQMIKIYQTMSEFGKLEWNCPLDIWLRSGIFEDEDFLLPEALLFIHKFEDQPPPEECAGFDLKAAYKFLFEACKKQPISNLPKRTIELMKQLMITVDKEIWPAQASFIADNMIEKLNKVPESERCYKRRKIDS